MDAEDLPAGDDRWFCPSCSLRQVCPSLIPATDPIEICAKKPSVKPSIGLKFMASLVEQVETTLPSEFSLPQDIRTFFKDGMLLSTTSVSVPDIPFM